MPMTWPGWYDMDGNRIDTMAAARLLGDIGARRVARDTINGFEISTVFLVLDHQHGDGPPLLWETMVWSPDREVVACWRTPTREAALAMHDQAVAEAREYVAP